MEGVFDEYRSMSQQAKEGRGEDYWGEYYDAEGLGEARTAGNITLVGVENLEDAWYIMTKERIPRSIAASLEKERE